MTKKAKAKDSTDVDGGVVGLTITIPFVDFVAMLRKSLEGLKAGQTAKEQITVAVPFADFLNAARKGLDPMKGGRGRG